MNQTVDFSLVDDRMQMRLVACKPCKLSRDLK